MIDFPEWGAGTGTFRLADEVARLQAVVAVQNEVSMTVGDLPTLMSLLAARAEEMTGATGATVEQPDGDALCCSAATGSATALLGSRLPIAGSLSGLALLTGEVIICEDTLHDLRIDHILEDRRGIRSLIAVPLVSSRKPFGVLQVVATTPDAFGHEHVQMLRLLGGIMSARVELAGELQAKQALLTQNTAALEALRESEGRFRHAFDNSGIGMALVAPDGRWLRVNATLSRIVGFSQAELLARDFQSITHEDDVAADVAFVSRMLSGEIATYELEKRYIHKSGSTVWILLTASLVRDARGLPLYFVSQIQDITARRSAEETLKTMAIRDELTGLFNRREMARLLQEELSRSQRHNRPLSLLMVDIDWFKRVNDTFGHQVGDRALQHVATTVLDSVRNLDRAARYGGEEMAVILPETSQTEALVVAERIRSRVAERSMPVEQNGGPPADLRLTVSIGVGTIAPVSGSTERLIGDADRALYAAKHRGRNCTVPSADVPTELDAPPRSPAAAEIGPRPEHLALPGA